MGTSEEKVHYTELLPHEFQQRLQAKPVAYLPLGTLEWHGPHLPLGSDSIQSEGLMVACARQLGGIVLPPLYLGPDQAITTQNGQTFGVTSDITRKWKYQIDHAGQNETSIMLALRPDLVDLTQLPPDPSPPPERILGKDPRHATDKLGKQYLDAAINILKEKFAKAGL